MEPLLVVLGVGLLIVGGASIRFSRQAQGSRNDAAAAHRQLAAALAELQAMRDEVQSLSGLLPMCAWCKKIRDDAGYWQQLEGYIQTHTGAEFSHSMCPDCFERAQADMPDARWRI